MPFCDVIFSSWSPMNNYRVISTNTHSVAAEMRRRDTRGTRRTNCSALFCLLTIQPGLLKEAAEAPRFLLIGGCSEMLNKCGPAVCARVCVRACIFVGGCFGGNVR